MDTAMKIKFMMIPNGPCPPPHRPHVTCPGPTKKAATTSRVLGPAHPDTLGVRREHARWTGLDGDPAARHELSELLPVMESTLGAEHPRTVAARRDLASWTEQAAE
jgi:hypothetical protein